MRLSQCCYGVISMAGGIALAGTFWIKQPLAQGAFFGGALVLAVGAGVATIIDGEEHIRGRKWVWLIMGVGVGAIGSMGAAALASPSMTKWVTVASCVLGFVIANVPWVRSLYQSDRHLDLNSNLPSSYLPLNAGPNSITAA